MRPFSIDFETALAQAAQLAPPGVLFGWTDSPTRGYEHIYHCRFERQTVHDHFEHALTDPNTVIIGANLPYDLGIAVNEFPDLWPLVFDALEQNRCYDALHAQKLIDIAKDCYFVNKSSYSLEGLARRLLNVDLDKDTFRLIYGTFLNTPVAKLPPGARDYLRGDVRSTFDIAAVQARDSDLLDDVYRQTRAAWWLYLMECQGFRTDPIAVRDLRRRVEKERDELAFRLRTYGLLRGDGTRNTKAAAERMVEICRAKGLEVKMTDGGEEGEPGVAIDEDACLLTEDATLKAYARYSSLNTIYTKDIPALSRPLIQSRYEVIVETGRTSCSGGKQKKGKPESRAAFQLQNVRKEPGVRECFVPRDGNYLLSVDYGQMELHAWAQVCMAWLGFSELGKLLNAKLDCHMMFGCRVNGFEDVPHAIANKKKDPFKDWRQAAKAALFGFPGGLGWKAFLEYARTQWGVILDEHTGKRLKKEWEQMFPEAGEYFRFMKNLVGDQRNYGTVTHLYSNRQRGGVHFTNACNSPFQGLAADCAKDAGFRISRACYIDRSSPLFGSRIVNFVHDEFILEVPTHVAHEAANETVKLMEDAGKIWMPDVPPRAEPALMRRWRKAAEPVYDAVTKRLIPWEPPVALAA